MRSRFRRGRPLVLRRDQRIHHRLHAALSYPRPVDYYQGNQAARCRTLFTATEYRKPANLKLRPGLIPRPKEKTGTNPKARTVSLGVKQYIEPTAVQAWPPMILSSVRISARTHHPFHIARAGASVDGHTVDRIIVRIEKDGIRGYGEAAPAPYYRQSLETVERTLQELAGAPEVFGEDLLLIDPIVRRLIQRWDDQRATIAAVDAALHDWVGRRLGVSTWRVLGLDGSIAPITSMTIGVDRPDILRRKVLEARDFDILKLKVGTPDDESVLSLIRELAPTKRLRLDANGAWPAERALDRIRALARFGPELIEQPIAAGQHEALRRLHAESPIPVYLDEDAVRPDDVLKLVGCATGINVKLSKCGGLREAWRMIERARCIGLKVMLGCMVETSLGISAAAQIASLVDHVDLDGHLLLADDPFRGGLSENQAIGPPSGPGLGIDASRLFQG